MLVEIVLGFTGCLNVGILLDLGDLWAMLVVVSVRVAALWASVFHGWLLVWVVVAVIGAPCSHPGEGIAGR